MVFPGKYSCLEQQVFTASNIKLVPIRYRDRYKIMKWRNEQIFHLRQSSPLVKEGQDVYFNDILSKQLSYSNPPQILFSILKNNVCMGYGGLVHIDWKTKIAEISFLTATELNVDSFNKVWGDFLRVIKHIAFEELSFRKIYTYAIDVRPEIYTTLVKHGFKVERVLPNEFDKNGVFFDVIIHSMKNNDY